MPSEMYTRKLTLTTATCGQCKEPAVLAIVKTINSTGKFTKQELGDLRACCTRCARTTGGTYKGDIALNYQLQRLRAEKAEREVQTQQSRADAAEVQIEILQAQLEAWHGNGRYSLFTDADIQEMKDRHGSGESIAAIARVMQCSRRTVKRYLEDWKPTNRSTKPKKHGKRTRKE